MKKYVRDFQEKDHIQSTFLVAEKVAGKDRNGKSFLSLALSDSTGRVNGRMFEKVDEFADRFEVGDVIWLKGFVQLFQNRKQLIVHDLRKAVEGEFKMTELVADLGGDPKEHLQQLIEIAEGLKDKFISRLILDTLNDPKLQPILLKAPAAKTIHHAYRGGLLEHVHSIVKVMQSLATHYPFLNSDLLVFGAIFHDLGKVFELDLSEGIHYTQSGRLVGHMVLACEIITQKAAVIPEFPADLLDVLKHIVLSHHGRLEYGSPKLPMLPEAMVVAMIDDLDSKMNTLFHFLRNEVEAVAPTEKWSHFHPGFERYFFLDYFRRQVKDPTKA